MSERSGFFNAVLQADGTYDRVYQAEDFSDCLSLFIPNGIYVTEEEATQETIDKTTIEGLKPYGSGTSLMITQGRGFINGQWYVLDEQDLEIQLEVNTEKAIVMLWTDSKKIIQVELIDLVDGNISVPKTDVQYGILLGKVSYTSSGVSVEDLREEFMNNSPKTLDAITKKAAGILSDLESRVNNILLLNHPVGSIYVTIDETNPSELFGGTWVAWGSGRVPVGVNASDSSFNTVEKTGGEKTHTLTTNEMPSHSHGTGVEDGSYYTYVGDEKHLAQVASGSTIIVVPYSNENAEAYFKDNTGSTGGGQAHNNLQPYITCYMWKRTA